MFLNEFHLQRPTITDFPLGLRHNAISPVRTSRVGGQASQYRPLSPVICEKCSKRYPRNKFPRNFPSYSSGKSLRSFDLSFLLPLPSLSPPSLFLSGVAGKERRRTRERLGERRQPEEMTVAGPVAIISLAATRQMSEHCETRRLVDRFAPRFCFSPFSK